MGNAPAIRSALKTFPVFTAKCGHFFYRRFDMFIQHSLVHMRLLRFPFHSLRKNVSVVLT